jgi:hypothetical protein
VEFVTLTIQHDQAMMLAPLLKLVSGGFRAVVGTGKYVLDWYTDRAAFGIVGQIKTLEVTHGANGWHPHLHVLVLTDRPLTSEERELMADGMWRRWSGYLEDKGHHGTTRAHGIDVRPVVAHNDVARYMAKVYDGLHHEMARADLKSGRRGGRNPFAILADLVDAGKYDRLTGELNRDFTLWREYEKAIARMSLVRWSPGLKARLGVLEATDEELAEEEVGGELVVELPLHLWALVRSNPARMALVLDVAEHHGAQGVLQLVHSWPLDRARARAA